MNKDNLLLYAITDNTWTGKNTLTEQIETALRGGISLLQLREKDLDEEEFVKKAVEVKALCDKYNVPLIINDNLNVALKSNASGVHVGMEDMPVSEIRRKTHEGFIIGATAKTVAQAQKAEADGADYLGVGAVFPSSTKKNAKRITKEDLKKITSSVSIPCVAIGGITLDNITQIKGSGVCCVAVVSAIFGADNISKACENLKEKALEVIKT